MEYTCTHADTMVTTHIITTERVSKRSDQAASKLPLSIHLKSSMDLGLCPRATSTKAKHEIKAARIKPPDVTS
jgi:hypothetical protein